MAFDPCGTRKLEGDEILKRLADYLDVPGHELEMALKNLVAKQIGTELINNYECDCTK